MKNVVGESLFAVASTLFYAHDLPETEQPTQILKNVSRFVAQPQTSVPHQRKSGSSLLHTNQRMSGTPDNYGMPLPPFTTWLQHRQIKMPEADRLLPLIAQAGQQGMNRGQIGNVIGLERDVLDELLDGLVRFGQLRLDVENGIRVYRAAV